MALTVKFVESDGSENELALAPKSFKTGSKGFYTQSKLGITVGSDVTVTLDVDGVVVDETVAAYHKFGTGSWGYWVGCKVQVGGEVYQYQAQAVVVNSKYSSDEPAGYVTCQCQSQAVAVNSRQLPSGANPAYYDFVLSRNHS